MDKLIARLKLIGKEILNFVTNIIVPIVPIIMFVLEICGVPENVLAKIKDIEYRAFQLFGTKTDLDK